MVTKTTKTPSTTEPTTSNETDSLLADLATPFPPGVERSLSKGGTSLTYIPVSEVINRMNRVLGVDRWSSEIIRCERDALDPDFIVAHVRISVRTVSPSGQEHVTWKDGFGGQKIKRTRDGSIVDLGDEFKGAVSDALKKAVQQLGVGLYLARSEESLLMDARADIDPQVDTLWEQFASLAKSLDADGRTALNSRWAEMSGNAPKPRRETATAETLRALIDECLLITTGGTFESDAADGS
jgi:hypothetical protein